MGRFGCGAAVRFAPGDAPQKSTEIWFAVFVNNSPADGCDSPRNPLLDAVREPDFSLTNELKIRYSLRCTVAGQSRGSNGFLTSQKVVH